MRKDPTWETCTTPLTMAPPPSRHGRTTMALEQECMRNFSMTSFRDASSSTVTGCLHNSLSFCVAPFNISCIRIAPCTADARRANLGEAVGDPMSVSLSSSVLRAMAEAVEPSCSTRTQRSPPPMAHRARTSTACSWPLAMRQCLSGMKHRKFTRSRSRRLKTASSIRSSALLITSLLSSSSWRARDSRDRPASTPGAKFRLQICPLSWLSLLCSSSSGPCRTNNARSSARVYLVPSSGTSSLNIWSNTFAIGLATGKKKTSKS
mmetsp:Transcript_19517/g.44226  ORF Transcript_19517/g.44226 Transcript_19517/m.44226 type:complete len:264 (-) Transcript_19517:126-917(-)